jgi:hypothetical protein
VDPQRLAALRARLLHEGQVSVEDVKVQEQLRRVQGVEELAGEESRGVSSGCRGLGGQ